MPLLSMRAGAQVVFVSCLVAFACSSVGSGGTGVGGTAGIGGSGGSSNTLPPCADVCVAVVAAQCSNGPPNQQECVSGCEQIRSGPCATQYRQLFECSGPDPDYGCTAQGSITVTGCEAEYGTLSTCLASP